MSRECLTLERGAAEPYMANDLSCFIARDIAARGNGAEFAAFTIAGVMRFKILPTQDFRRGIVSVRQVRRTRLLETGSVP